MHGRAHLLEDRVLLLAIGTGGVLGEPASDAVLAGEVVAALVALHGLLILGEHLVANPAPQVVLHTLGDLIVYHHPTHGVHGLRGRRPRGIVVLMQQPGIGGLIRSPSGLQHAALSGV